MSYTYETDVAPLIQYLRDKGTERTRHSGRTLLYHLSRTERLLRFSGAPGHVCKAGLFHSIYGTSAFRRSTVHPSRREEIQALIGEDAEYLVWLFGNLQRPAALKAYVAGESSYLLRDGSSLSKADLRDADSMDQILTIEVANLLDQQVLWHNSWLVPHAKKVGLVGKDGFALYRSTDQAAVRRDVEFRRMLASGRDWIRQRLQQKVQWIRDTALGISPHGQRVALQKLAQAHEVIRSSGAESQVSVELIKNMAEAAGITLLEAAQRVVAVDEYRFRVEYATEMLLDRFHGLIERAESSKDIDLLRRKIDEIDLTFLEKSRAFLPLPS